MAVILAMSLGGCATAPSERLKVVTPKLKAYSPQFQQATADELDHIQDTAPHVVEMINDYGQLRAAIRSINR